MLARTPLDSDLFWHLRAGTDTLDTLRPVLVDHYSYTRAGEPWVNHSWLGQVVLALVYRWLGWLGLSALVAGLAALLALLLFRRMSGPALWRAFIIVLAMLAAAPVLSPRPQIFSLALLVVLDWLLDRRLSPGAKAAWVIGLFILWSNLHGGYVLGMILLGCRGAGALIDIWSGRQADVTLRPVIEPFALAGLGLLFAAVNPNGAAMWRIPFQTVGIGALQNYIPEWASPDFHELAQQPFLWMLASLLGAMSFSGQPRRGGDVVKVVVLAAMGLAARRNFAPFALIAAPVLSASGWEVLSRWMGRFRWGKGGGSASGGWVQRVVNLGLFAVVVLAAAGKLVFVSHPAVVGAYMRQQFPADALETLRAEHPPGRMFSTYAWGGFLIWSLPEYPVFVDGRTDLYGDEVIGEWLEISTARESDEHPGWRDLLRQRGITLALLPPGEPLARAMLRDGWHVLFADEAAMVLRRPE